MMRKACRISVFLVAVLTSAASAPVSAAEPVKWVYLVHPKHRAWVAPLEASLKPNPAIRVEVGDSVKNLKDWTFTVQFGVASEGPPVGSLAPSIRVPFAVHFWDGAKAVEVGRGTVVAPGNPGEKTAEQRFTEAFHGTYRDVLAGQLAGQLFEGRTGLIAVSIYKYGYVFARLDRTVDPPVATFTLHNRLPVDAMMAFELECLRGRPPYVVGQKLSLPPFHDSPQIHVAAGKKRTISVGLKGFQADQVGVRVVLRSLQFAPPQRK